MLKLTLVVTDVFPDDEDDHDRPCNRIERIYFFYIINFLFVFR